MHLLYNMLSALVYERLECCFTLSMLNFKHVKYKVFVWKVTLSSVYMQALGSDPRTGRLKLDQLLHILQTEGEQMTRYDLSF